MWFLEEELLGLQKFLHGHNLLWFLQSEVVGLNFLVLESWDGVPAVDLGILTPEISLLNLYPPHMGVGPTRSASAPLLPVWMWFL